VAAAGNADPPARSTAGPRAASTGASAACPRRPTEVRRAVHAATPTRARVRRRAPGVAPWRTGIRPPAASPAPGADRYGRRLDSRRLDSRRLDSRRRSTTPCRSRRPVARGRTTMTGPRSPRATSSARSPTTRWPTPRTSSGPVTRRRPAEIA